MKRQVITLLLICATVAGWAQKDLVILRDGTMMNCKIIQVSTNYTIYKEDDSKKSREQRIDNAQLYMIKYEKRGNVFFTESGDRFNGMPTGKVSGDATIMYLRQGEEIVAYDLNIGQSIVSYKVSSKKKAMVKTVPKNQVFLICYPDGTRDVLTSFKAAESASAGMKNATINTQQGQVVASVIAESDNIVVYKKSSDLNGPTYCMDKTATVSVQY